MVDMKCISKTTLGRRASAILSDNEGASLVLVTIIAIIIITGVIVLRITTSALWASADKQYNQDQAYLAATSLGDSIDRLIRSGSSPEDFTSREGVKVTSSEDIYTVEVTATCGNATYVYTAIYRKTGSSFIRQY